VHDVNILPGGLLADLIHRSHIKVNSLHGQGIDRLAPGLRPEAVADDGLIEAFTMPSAPGFNLAVQWHPEWHVIENPVSLAMFEAFGRACRARIRSGA
jgi:putative glutamine amidotransferase